MPKASSTTTLYSRAARGHPGYRWSIAARAVAATLGGYALAALCAAALALRSDAPREEAIAAAVLPGFVLQIAAAIWAFWASTVLRAWLGIGLPALVFGVVIIWIQNAAA
ncbi:MAG: hypothetical protein ABII82_06690 [Verrucomicrobiota bacterium]